MEYIEQWGLIGVFIAGAIPWMEAIAVVPVGILLGLNPLATVVAAVTGNALTIVLFAYSASNIRERLIQRRIRKGKTAESPKLEKALKSFDKYGIYGVAALGPIIIGTQFAAVAAVSAGTKPARASILIIVSTLVWAAAIAIVMVAFDVSF
ncbi:MAG: small multi-drug export protein [Actinomycetes bacterium]